MFDTIYRMKFEIGDNKIDDEIGDLLKIALYVYLLASIMSTMYAIAKLCFVMKSYNIWLSISNIDRFVNFFGRMKMLYIWEDRYVEPTQKAMAIRLLYILARVEHTQQHSLL